MDFEAPYGSASAWLNTGKYVARRTVDGSAKTLTLRVAGIEMMPLRVRIFYGDYPSVGHGGTYNQSNSEPFGQVAVAWLRWQLQSDNSDKAKGCFVGGKCKLCTDSSWIVQSRSLR